MHKYAHGTAKSRASCSCSKVYGGAEDMRLYLEIVCVSLIDCAVN